MPSRNLFQCKVRHPKRQFSVKVGTIFEDSPIALGKWLLIGWMLANCRNGISSHEVARTIGITQKSAWFMLHRLRAAAESEPQEKLFGEVEADETFIGPKPQKMHREKRLKMQTAERGKANAIVMGMLSRTSREIRAKVIPDVSRDVLQSEIFKEIEQGSEVFTDGWSGYDRLLLHGYLHQVINHTTEYVNGQIHTQGLDNFWSLLKRCIKGTYIQVRPEHLQAYVAEQVFRYNTRKKLNVTEQQRFSTLLERTTGKRLTYAELITRQ
jgi:transposase-like protein